MIEAYVGEIRLFAGNYAPSGWAMCNGQLLSIAQNTLLYAILGITYGGNGQDNFALPDLRGRVPIHAESGQYFGQTRNKQQAAAGSEVTVPATLALNYIICLQGTYPSRD